LQRELEMHTEWLMYTECEKQHWML